MPLHISIRVPTDAVNGIRDRLHQSIDSAREQMVQSATQAALDEIVNNVPVDTGETQGEWQAEQTRIAASPPVVPPLTSRCNPPPTRPHKPSTSNTAPPTCHLAPQLDPPSPACVRSSPHSSA